MVIHINSNCSVTQPRAGDRPVIGQIAVNGFMNIEVGPFPGITLTVVRSVFGQENAQTSDLGIDPHGHTYERTAKGSVVYSDPERLAREGLTSGTEFYFKLDPPGTRRDSKIYDDDVVTRISMHDTQYVRLGK